MPLTSRLLQRHVASVLLPGVGLSRSGCSGHLAPAGLPFFVRRRAVDRVSTRGGGDDVDAAAAAAAADAADDDNAGDRCWAVERTTVHLPWLLDLQKTCASLAAALISAQIAGTPVDGVELTVAPWLESPLLSCGLDEAEGDIAADVLPKLFAPDSAGDGNNSASAACAVAAVARYVVVFRCWVGRLWFNRAAAVLVRCWAGESRKARGRRFPLTLVAALFSRVESRAWDYCVRQRFW